MLKVIIGILIFLFCPLIIVAIVGSIGLIFAGIIALGALASIIVETTHVPRFAKKLGAALLLGWLVIVVLGYIPGALSWMRGDIPLLWNALYAAAIDIAVLELLIYRRGGVPYTDAVLSLGVALAVLGAGGEAMLPFVSRYFSQYMPPACVLGAAFLLAGLLIIMLRRPVPPDGRVDTCPPPQKSETLWINLLVVGNLVRVTAGLLWNLLRLPYLAGDTGVLAAVYQTLNVVDLAPPVLAVLCVAALFRADPRLFASGRKNA